MTSPASRRPPSSGNDCPLNLPDICPADLSVAQADLFWMAQALALADHAEIRGEVPVGAVLVRGRRRLACGWNRVIELNDPTAHAEVVALRAAGQALQNYRLLDTTLYVTLEPCPMCAGALVHARVGRLVYGAADARAGACGSLFQMCRSPLLNHRLQVHGDVLAAESAQRLRRFFQQRRYLTNISKK